jgi:hypothetical protein
VAAANRVPSGLRLSPARRFQRGQAPQGGGLVQVNAVAALGKSQQPAVAREGDKSKQAPGVARQPGFQFPRTHLPEVKPAEGAGDEPAAIRTERHAEVYTLPIEGQTPDKRALRDVPNADGVVVAGDVVQAADGDGPAAIRAERDPLEPLVHAQAAGPAWLGQGHEVHAPVPRAQH